MPMCLACKDKELDPILIGTTNQVQKEQEKRREKEEARKKAEQQANARRQQGNARAERGGGGGEAGQGTRSAGKRKEPQTSGDPATFSQRSGAAKRRALKARFSAPVLNLNCLILEALKQLVSPGLTKDLSRSAVRQLVIKKDTGTQGRTWSDKQEWLAVLRELQQEEPDLSYNPDTDRISFKNVV